MASGDSPSIGIVSVDADKSERGFSDNPLGNGDFIDPESGSASRDTGSSAGNGKRRGRKPGTKNKSANAKTQVDISSLESLLFTTHMMLAAVIEAPEIALSEDESKKLATASANVLRHYEVKASAKAIDWTHLCIVLAMVYGTRIMAYSQRIKKQQAEKQEEKIRQYGDRIVPFTA